MRSKSIARTLILVALLGLAVIIAGCGDSADQSSDPQELLDETFGGEGTIDSGVLDLSLKASSTGKSAGSLDASLGGPFETRDSDQLPLLDVEGSLEAKGGGQNVDFAGGLTVTDDAAFVTVDGQAYAVDDPTFSSLSAAFAQSSQQQQGDTGSAVFDQLGIDPASWLTDVSNEGTEEIDGTETVHITGTADVAQIVADAQAIDPTGNALGETASQQLADAVQSATVDVYTGAEDTLLRRLDVSVAIEDPGSAGAVLSFDLSIGVNGVNEDQSIEAPADAKPIDELVPGGLGALAGGALGGAGLGGASGDTGTGGTGGDAGGTVPGFTPEYQDCVSAAKSEADFSECAKLLG